LPRAELHLHTTESDGSQSPERAVKEAVRRGLSALAVTDHNTFRGSSLAMRISKLLGGPLIIPGNEVRTDYGDVLVYCPEPHEEAPKPLAELRDWADENNCVLVVAHPFQPGKHSVGLATRRLISYFDAVEVWNSRGLPCLNALAILLARKHGKPMTSGSDAHTPQEVATAPVELPGEPETVEDVLEWIRKGRVKPLYRPMRPWAIPYILAWSVKRRLGRGE